MAIIQVSLMGAGTPPAGNWNAVTDPNTAGQKIADLIDSSGAPTGVSLWVTDVGTSATSASNATQAHHGLPEAFWDNHWLSENGGIVAVELRGLAPGSSYSIDVAAFNGSGRDSDITVEGSTQTYATAGTEPPEAPITFSGSVPGDGIISVSSTKAATGGQFYGYLNGFVVNTSASATPTITNIDTDNAVNQYQQCNANGVSGLAGPVTSGTLGGQAVTIVDGDWQANSGVVALGLPGNLATDTYSLVLSDGTNSATLTGVSYTQTHARPAFDGLVDSNSILSGQSYTPNTYFRFVTSFSNGTLDTAAGDADEWAGDIADYYTPNAGFTGDDTASIEFLYSDGTTSATVNVTVSVLPTPVNLAATNITATTVRLTWERG